MLKTELWQRVYKTNNIIKDILVQKCCSRHNEANSLYCGYTIKFQSLSDRTCPSLKAWGVLAVTQGCSSHEELLTILHLYCKYIYMHILAYSKHNVC